MKMLWLALLLISTAALVFWLASRQRKGCGLPGGDIVYSDTGLWEETQEAFYDSRLNLTGKPDYVIRQGYTLIPVEVKTGRTPIEPYDSHIFQLSAYCYLADQATGLRPPFGVLHYPKQTFTIDYTEAMENALLALIVDIREQEKRKRDLPRSHAEAGRCRACGFRDICDDRLH